MTQKFGISLMFAATPLLSGCVVQGALAAASLAQQLPQAKGQSNAHLMPTATQACTQQAQQYGSVYVVDVEQRRADRIIVWGSVTDPQQRRRTFECHFTTKLASFKLRDI
jgi:hypothetical protein